MSFGLDANTVMLLHFLGPNASTTVKDFSTNDWSITANGSAQQSTDQSKFFGSALLLDSTTSDYLSIPDDDKWDVDTGDLYLESFPLTGQTMTFMGQGSSGTYYYMFDIWNNGGTQTLRFNGRNGGSQFTLIGKEWAGAALTTWFHIAFERQSDDHYIYVDGTSLGTTNTTDRPTTYAAALHIGASSEGAGSNYLDGRIDELRFSDTARYGGTNFTPPTIAYHGDIVPTGLMLFDDLHV